MSTNPNDDYLTREPEEINEVPKLELEDESVYAPSEKEELIAEIRQISEKISDEHAKTREKLEKENRELRRELERYQQSVPLAVYSALLIGTIILLYSITVSKDLIHFIGGASIILISVTAVIESKYREGRKR